MIDPFYLASVPEPRTILGLPLRPFSLGHVILLHRVESAFVTGGVPDFNDLALSVFICSQTFEGAIEAFNDMTLPKFMRKWHERLTGADKWIVKLGLRKATLLDFEGAVKRFTEYLTEHSKVPKYDFNPGDFREMECPQVQIVKLALMRDLHIKESDILDRSWALCLSDFIGLKAMKGEVRIYQEETLESALAAAKELAENIKSGKFKFRCQS